MASTKVLQAKKETIELADQLSALRSLKHDANRTVRSLEALVRQTESHQQDYDRASDDPTKVRLFASAWICSDVGWRLRSSYRQTCVQITDAKKTFSDTLTEVKDLFKRTSLEQLGESNPGAETVQNIQSDDDAKELEELEKQVLAAE